MYERSVVAAVLTNGLLDAVQPGTDARVAAKRVVLLYQAILSELARKQFASRRRRGRRNASARSGAAVTPNSPHNGSEDRRELRQADPV